MKTYELHDMQMFEKKVFCANVYRYVKQNSTIVQYNKLALLIAHTLNQYDIIQKKINDKTLMYCLCTKHTNNGQSIHIIAAHGLLPNGTITRYGVYDID